MIPVWRRDGLSEGLQVEKVRACVCEADARREVGPYRGRAPYRTRVLRREVRAANLRVEVWIAAVFRQVEAGGSS